jgi:hypothetical protein
LCWRNPCYLGYYPALRPPRMQIAWPFLLSSVNKVSIFTFAFYLMSIHRSVT